MMFKYCVKKFRLARTFYTFVTQPIQMHNYAIQAQRLNKLSDMFSFLRSNLDEFQNDKLKIFSTLCWKLRNIEIDKIEFTEEEFKSLLDKLFGQCKYFKQFLLVYKFLIYFRKNDFVLKQLKKSKITEKHLLETIKKLKNYMEENINDQEFDTICDYFAVTNSAKSFSHSTLQIMKIKRKQIQKIHIMKLMKSFLLLPDIQRQFIYNFTYEICSKIDLTQWNQLQQAKLLYQLRELNLQKNTTFQKSLYLQKRLQQNIINSQISLECAKFILKINKLSTQKQKKIFVYMPLSEDIQYCIEFLENKQDYPIIKLIKHCEAVLMDYFKKQNNLYMLNRISTLIGEKLSWTNILYEKYINCRKWNLKYYVDWLRIGSSLKIDMSEFYLYCFRKVKQKCDDPRNQILHLRVIKEFQQLKKKQLNIKIIKNNEVKQIQVLIIENFMKIMQNTTKYFKILYIKEYTKYFFKSQIPAFKEKLLPLVITTFQNLHFNFYQKMYILLNSQQVDQQTLKNFPIIPTKSLKRSEINSVKIIYAAINNKSQSLFRLIWNRFSQCMEPKDKIQILLKTPCQIAQVKFKQVFGQKIIQFSEQQINIRQIILMFNYIIDKVNLWQLMRINLIDYQFMNIDDIYRKIETLIFILKIVDSQQVNVGSILQLFAQQLSKISKQILKNEYLMQQMRYTFFSLVIKILSNKKLKVLHTIERLEQSALQIANEISLLYASKEKPRLYQDTLKDLIVIIQLNIVCRNKVQYVEQLLDILNMNKCEEIIYHANCNPFQLRKLITNKRIKFA